MRLYGLLLGASGVGAVAAGGGLGIDRVRPARATYFFSVAASPIVVIAPLLSA